MNKLTDIELPSPPNVALKLIELCGGSECDLDAIMEAVTLDAALTARFLKLANSAKYSQRYEVSTLRRAAVVLGTQYVKVVALGFHLSNLSNDWSDLPMDLKPVWQGHILRGCLARRLAANSHRTHGAVKEEAFLVGMLQDYAVPLFARAIGAGYAAIIGQGGLYTCQETQVRERELISTDHAELAGDLFNKWALPRELAQPIALHHTPPDWNDPRDKTTALWQIAYWVGAVKFNDDRQTAPVAGELRDFARMAFGLDTSLLAQVFYDAIEEYEAVHPIFDRVLPPKTDAASLLWRAQELILELRTAGGEGGSEHGA